MYYCLSKPKGWADKAKSVPQAMPDSPTSSPQVVEETNSINIITWYDNKEKVIDNLSEPSMELIQQLFQVALAKHYPCV
eukprot:5631748-Ditylum_brightwellii.AAC.1